MSASVQVTARELEIVAGLNAETLSAVAKLCAATDWHMSVNTERRWMTRLQDAQTFATNGVNERDQHA